MADLLLELPDDLIARLQALASMRALPLEDYVRDIIHAGAERIRAEDSMSASQPQAREGPTA